MNINELYDALILNKSDLSTFLKVFIISLHKNKKLKQMLVIMPELERVVKALKKENIFNEVNRVLNINQKNYYNSKYYKILESSNESFNFATLFNSFSKVWRGKMGILKNGSRYALFDKNKSEKALLEFIENNKDIPIDVILKANEEFMQSIEKDKYGNIRYAPKCSTFIKGNEKNGYLIEYCYNILNRVKEQNSIKTQNTFIDGGFWKDL